MKRFLEDRGIWPVRSLEVLVIVVVILVILALALITVVCIRRIRTPDDFNVALLALARLRR